MDVFSKNLALFPLCWVEKSRPHRYGSFHRRKCGIRYCYRRRPGKSFWQPRGTGADFSIEWRWWWNRGDNLSAMKMLPCTNPIRSLPSKPIPRKNQFCKHSRNQRSLPHTGNRSCFGPCHGTHYPALSQLVEPTIGQRCRKCQMLNFCSRQGTVPSRKCQNYASFGSEGHALVSIENGTEVLSTQWIATEKGEIKSLFR